MQPPISDMAMLGRLLRCPSGDKAIALADYMFASNETMIASTLAQLQLPENGTLLEIGFGGGGHLSALFTKLPTVHYTGIDASAAMVAYAQRQNASYTESGKARFLCASPEKPLSLTGVFNAAFMVNVLYFISDPKAYFTDLYTHLSLGGQLLITCIDKALGAKIPFAQEDFTFYDVDEVEAILTPIGFTLKDTKTFTETLISKDGKRIERRYWVASFKK
jgi:mraW methylase family